METAVYTPFGKAVKIRLIEMGVKQKWLIEEVRTRTGLYFDTSYLHKILIGQLATPKIVQAIREILELPAQDDDTTSPVQ